MPIDPTQNNPRIANTELRGIKTRPSQEPVKQPDASASFQPSSETRDARDIDQARVAEIRQAISEGKLEIRPERIADGLIASARELVNGG